MLSCSSKLSRGTSTSSYIADHTHALTHSHYDFRSVALQHNSRCKPPLRVRAPADRGKKKSARLNCADTHSLHISE